MKVKKIIEMLKPCAPDAELSAVKIYRTATGEEAVDVVYKTAETIEIEELKNQVTRLKAALIEKRDNSKIEIVELKNRALDAFLECEG